MIIKILLTVIFLFKSLNSQEFKGTKLSCFHCNVNKMDKQFLKKLKRLERKCGYDFMITCGYRCKTYNTKIKGYYKSKHIDGLAVDIQPNLTKRQIMKLKKLACKSNYFTKIIDEQDHFHIEAGGKYFEFKEKPDLGNYKKYSNSNSWFLGMGRKIQKNDFIRFGYYLTDKCGANNNYIYIDKIYNEGNFKLFDKRSSIGIGRDNYLNEPYYYGFHILFSNIESINSNKAYWEPNINLGLLYKFINFQINLGCSIINEDRSFFSGNNKLGNFHINSIITFGVFKRNK